MDLIGARESHSTLIGSQGRVDCVTARRNISWFYAQFCLNGKGLVIMALEVDSLNGEFNEREEG